MQLIRQKREKKESNQQQTNESNVNPNWNSLKPTINQNDAKIEPFCVIMHEGNKVQGMSQIKPKKKDSPGIRILWMLF
jgi:hypothetical protein